jgi:hypothetical protein
LRGGGAVIFTTARDPPSKVESSGLFRKGIQSVYPSRQQRFSLFSFPMEMKPRTLSRVTGPIGSSSMATNHSTRSGSRLGLLARSDAVRRSSSSNPGALICVWSSSKSLSSAWKETDPMELDE